jgi:hypothetical protein
MSPGNGGDGRPCAQARPLQVQGIDAFARALTPKGDTFMFPALIGGGFAFAFLTIIAILFRLTVVEPDQQTH